jgi:polysaccharide export outer membrane protein
MIARVLITFTAAIALSSAALAQQPSPTPREAVGTSGSTTTTPATTKPPQVIAAPAPATAAAAAPARVVEPVRVDPKDYRIGPEDILDINVWKNPELSRERVPVRPDGKVSHPLINDIDVAGKTTNQVKAELTEYLSKYIENPEVAVVVREIHSPKVSVSGNVRMPGYFELKTTDVTVLDMIARAQGLNEFADKGNIKVIRRGDKGAIDFRYNDAINGRNNANFVVQPGDVIVVQ